MSIRRMIPMGTTLRKCIVCGEQQNAHSGKPTAHELKCLEDMIRIAKTKPSKDERDDKVTF
jgi:hypothetical protein